MAALLLGEVEPRDEPPRLGHVAVLNGSLQVLAHRQRLAQLGPQPAEKAYLERRDPCRHTGIVARSHTACEPGRQ